jgi:hypothetical protein
MSEPLLGDENRVTAKRYSNSVSTTMLKSVFGFKTKIQSVALKAVSEKESQKSKYILGLQDFLHKDATQLDLISVTWHALSKWKKSVAVCCNVLTALLVLFQTGPTVENCCLDSVNQLLINIRDYWATQEHSYGYFLSQFSVVLLQRLNFLADNRSFNVHFNLSTTSSNGQSVPEVVCNEALSLLSLLLSAQNRLVTLMNNGYNLSVIVSPILPSTALSSVKRALLHLYEDSFVVYVACVALFRVLPADKVSSVEEVLRDQFCEQFNALQLLYKGFTSDEMKSYATYGYGSAVGFEISQFPSSNPLFSPPSIAPTAKLGIGSVSSMQSLECEHSR